MTHTTANVDPRLEPKSLECETYDLLQSGYTVNEACDKTGIDEGEFTEYRRWRSSRRIDDRRLGRALGLVINGSTVFFACMQMGISQPTFSNNQARAIAGLKQIHQEAASA